MFAEQSYRDNHEHFAGRNDKANFRKELKEDGTYLLDVSYTLGTRMTIVITGLPISELIMNSSGVHSLEFIKNMPIKKLDISNTSVKDIGVLSTLPIEELNIKDTYIVDLKPLRKTQIKRLILGDYPIDIKALTSLACLEYIEIPKGGINELLDNLKLTDKISYR